MDLPLRPSEAAELGNLIFDQAERKPLTDEIRNRIAARGAILRLETIRPYFGSLERDPVHPSAYYMAVDGEHGTPLLLHVAPAAAPTSSVFYKPLLIGRMRRADGLEMVINAIPFGPEDGEQVETFCARMGSAFVPRPHGQTPSLTVGGADPEVVMPAAFEAFRAIQKRTGRNVASVAGALRPILWSAVRAGWRAGYNATLELGVTPETMAEAKKVLRQNAGFSTFALRLPVSPVGAADEGLFERTFTPEERGWIFEEFGGGLEITAAEVIRLSLQFGPMLRLVEDLHEWIRQGRSAMKAARSFDFELSLEGAGFPTSPAEAIFCLHWLKQHGHAAQLLAPRLGSGAELEPQLEGLAAAARLYHARISIGASGEHTPAVLERIARATQGRVNYRIWCEGSDAAGQVNSVAEHLVG